MAYRLDITQPVSDNVRRIASEEIKCAVTHLRNSGKRNREEDIHEARKAIKRIRALLRLVRPELGRIFRQENAALRDIGRSLSDLRDASIVLETFDSLAEHASHQELQPLRRNLQQQKRAKEKTVDREQTLHAAADGLTAVGDRIPQWTLHSDGFGAIAKGLKVEYRGGRQEMRRALHANDSVLFHEWRKRAKSQLFHMRLLSDTVPDTLEYQEKSLHQLESALGDDHNLLILRQHLDAHPEAANRKAILKRSLHLVSDRESELRSKAEVLGRRVYAYKPKEFVELLRAEWERASTAHSPRRKRKTTAA